VAVSINANANILLKGNYNDIVTFRNTNSNVSQTRPVMLKVKSKIIIFCDDMESGTGNWSLDYPWGLTTSTYKSPNHSLTDSPSGNYGIIKYKCNLDSEIDLTNYTSVILEIQTKYFTESCCDYGYIEVSTNGGLNWSNQVGYVRGPKQLDKMSSH